MAGRNDMDHAITVGEVVGSVVGIGGIAVVLAALLWFLTILARGMSR